MHFCQDEARALITAIQHPDLMLAHALAYFKRLWVGLKRVCRRCPEHCPKPKFVVPVVYYPRTYTPNEVSCRTKIGEGSHIKCTGKYCTVCLAAKRFL